MENDSQIHYKHSDVNTSYTGQITQVETDQWKYQFTQMENNFDANSKHFGGSCAVWYLLSGIVAMLQTTKHPHPQTGMVPTSDGYPEVCQVPGVSEQP